MYKQDFALDNLQGWYTIKPNQPTNQWTNLNTIDLAIIKNLIFLQISEDGGLCRRHGVPIHSFIWLMPCSIT